MNTKIILVSVMAVLIGCAHTGMDSKEVDSSVEWLTAETYVHPKTCQNDELAFSFENLSLRAAFEILSDFGKVGLDISGDIGGISQPIYFTCTPWNVAAKGLAKRNNLDLTIENGEMKIIGR